MKNTGMHCYLTVDLEDYKYSTMRDMGIKPVADPEQTQRGVEQVISVLNKVSGSKNITFFTTGQVARDNPTLVSELSQEGHEIACHTNNHDNIYNLSRKGFESTLLTAVKVLEDCSGQKIRGFRAPNFSINESCLWAYEVLSYCGFIYDSSIIRSDRRYNVTEYDYVENVGKVFYEFPLFSIRFFGNKTIKIIGGSYFRLIPEFIIIRLMKKAVEKGYVPIIYLHPHDMNDKFSAIPISEMEGLGFFPRIKWLMHQKLWTTGRKSTAKKLEFILRVFPNKGPLIQSLPPFQSG